MSEVALNIYLVNVDPLILPQIVGIRLDGYGYVYVDMYIYEFLALKIVERHCSHSCRCQDGNWRAFLLVDDYG